MERAPGDARRTFAQEAQRHPPDFVLKYTAMSAWSPHDKEKVIVLSTKKPLPGWLQLLLKALAALLVLAIIVAGVIGWKYYAVHQRLKKDMAVVVRTEEHIRSLGGINAAPDLIIPNAPRSWRYRYLSSVRAHKGRPEPAIQVKSVEYDGVNARVRLLMDDVVQWRHYKLLANGWRRAPFIATGWGYRQTLAAGEDFEIIYWDEDNDFAQKLAADLPALAQQMQALALTPVSKQLLIIPQELGDLVHPAKKAAGLTLNSPHVDLIPGPLSDLSSAQQLRLALARKLITDARQQALVTSDLPGAARVQAAIDEMLVWHWAVGDVADEALAAWAQKLKGRWVSPVTGLPPTLITELPPDAPDAAASLMMAFLLRKAGADALFALSAAIPTAKSWDEAYEQAVGKTALQVEQAARALQQAPTGALPDWPAAGQPPIPQALTLLTTQPDAKGRLLAQTAAGDVLLILPATGAALTLVDGSALQYECVAAGSQVQVQGDWLDAGVQLKFESMTLEQAVLPPVLRAQPLDAAAEMLAWRYRENANGDLPQLDLVQLFPGAVANAIAHPYPSAAPFSPTLSRPGRSPLLFWQQTGRCNRNWILAYDPEQGLIDSWLAPIAAPSLVGAHAISGEQNAFLFSFRQGEKPVFFQNSDHHVLHQLSEEEWRASLRSASHRSIQFIDSKTQTVQIYDSSTQTQSLLYRPAAGEKLQTVIPVFGGPDDLVIFSLQMEEESTAITRLMSASLNRPGEATKFFDTLPGGVITSLVFCPDKSYLYGVKDLQNNEPLSILRLHKSDHDDFAITATYGDVVTPVYCARTPQ